MRTRCPHCATTFRVTPEQLRARGGKVRCGQCRNVFDAFDGMVEEVPAVLPVSPPLTELPPTPVPVVELAPAETPGSPVFAPLAVDTPAAAVTPEPEPEFATDVVADAVVPPLVSVAELPEEIASSPSAEQEAVVSEPAVIVEEITVEPVTAETIDIFGESTPAAVAEVVEEPMGETPEESARQAREAGLMAARDLHQSPAFDRWSAGTLMLDAHGRIVEGGQSSKVVWPFIAAAILLVLALIWQVALHFRLELVQRVPDLRGVFETAGAEIPLPRDIDQISIETSDLQSDTARGLLVLQATVKNRSPYAQAWPALELTLTDNDDAVVTRRVLQAADYLPPKADPQAFAGASEIGLRLWLESKTPAAGYRLYVFYP